MATTFSIAPVARVGDDDLRGVAERGVDRRVRHGRVAELLRPVDDVLGVVVDVRRAQPAASADLARLLHARRRPSACRGCRWSGRSRARGWCRRSPRCAPGRRRARSTATCSATVCTPWPISVNPWRTSTLPTRLAGAGDAEAHDRRRTPRAGRCRGRSSSGRGRCRRPCPRRARRRCAAWPDRGTPRRRRQPSSMIWPGPHTSPGWMTLRLRISQPLMPTCSARRSITPSIANCAWLAPKPRNAPHTGLLVRTAMHSTSMVGTRYGPLAWPAARSSTFMPDAGVRAGVADAAHPQRGRACPSASQPAQYSRRIG